MKQIADAEVLPASFADQLPLGEGFIMAGMPIPVNRRGSSFTALLELPPIQAVELLHAAGDLPANLPTGHQDPHSHPRPYPMLMMKRAPAFPTNAALPKNYPILVTGGGGKDSPVSSSEVKCDEPADTGSNPNLMTEVSDSMAASPPNEKPPKRKVGEKKGKGSSCKKSRTTESEDEDGENLPYVHVRARRGQATNSHSLAERARRDKINARMKLLQELVPGCNKLSGTALVLDEIINHVRSLQRQVEYLSMKLAAAYPKVNFNLESFLATNGSLMESSSCTSMVMPPQSQTWPDFPIKGDRLQCQQQLQLEALTRPVWAREEENRNLVAFESSLFKL